MQTTCSCHKSITIPAAIEQCNSLVSSTAGNFAICVQHSWEKVKTAMELLPRHDAVRQAAATAVNAAINTPWTLTDNFLACTDKDTQKMFLTISGA